MAGLAVAAAGAWLWWTARQAGPPQRNLDVLLITIDTLRADALGAYGNRRVETPSIDRLAAAGLRFDDAHAHNVTTLASHANILSGRYPTEHGVRDNSGFRFPAQIETLATLLKARGYRTGAFVSAFPLAARFGLARGFEVYDDRFVDATARPAFVEQERRGTDTVALARRWIADRNDRRPYFCWVHLYEPHFPYAPPEPFASRFARDPYLGDVSAADAALAPLLDPIVDSPRDAPLVVLTADHGESLGEHGEATHGIFAYEATLKVPMIVFQPHLAGRGVVSEPVRHVDILPTILDALSIQAPDGLPGRSLLRLLKAGARADANRSRTATYFEAMSGTLNRGWAPLSGIIRGRFKYIDLPLPELYDLENDPHETHNLADAESRRVEEMRAALAAVPGVGGRIEGQPEDLATRERLRSLGYFAGGATEKRRYTADDDPKRLIGLDALLQDVATRYAAGDIAGALERCRELVRRRPTMALSYLELAHLEREAGHLPNAIDALEKARSLNPGDTQTLSLLGSYLTQAGRAREAVATLQPYLASADADVEVVEAGALALASAGRPQDALGLLAQARARDPGSALLAVHTGTVYVMAGDRERARHEFEEALAINPAIARAHSSLAVIDAEQGRTDAALADWRRAIELDPREIEKLFAFGEFLRRSGRSAAARPYLELFVALAPPDRFGLERQRARQWLERTR